MKVKKTAKTTIRKKTRKVLRKAKSQRLKFLILM